MHKKLIELLAQHEKSDYYTQLIAAREVVETTEDGVDQLGYWVGEFESTPIYSVLMQVFFEKSFTRIKGLITDESMDMEIRLHSATCLKWFREYDFCVKIAMNTLGSELFEKLEDKFLEVQRELYANLLPHFTGRKRSIAINEHREFIAREFGQSRYLSQMLTIFDEECAKID